VTPSEPSIKNEEFTNKTPCVLSKSLSYMYSIINNVIEPSKNECLGSFDVSNAEIESIPTDSGITESNDL
jgi:hypothetical protein